PARPRSTRPRLRERAVGGIALRRPAAPAVYATAATETRRGRNRATPSRRARGLRDRGYGNAP
ncbi:MAG: hypothetical protein ACYC4U_33300, partial [Pirellulaceae bacterium]